MGSGQRDRLAAVAYKNSRSMNQECVIALEKHLEAHEARGKDTSTAEAAKLFQQLDKSRRAVVIQLMTMLTT